MLPGCPTRLSPQDSVYRSLRDRGSSGLGYSSRAHRPRRTQDSTNFAAVGLSPLVPRAVLRGTRGDNRYLLKIGVRDPPVKPTPIEGGTIQANRRRTASGMREAVQSSEPWRETMAGLDALRLPARQDWQRQSIRPLSDRRGMLSHPSRAGRAASRAEQR